MATQQKGNLVRQVLKGGSVAATVATIIGGWAAIARSAPGEAATAPPEPEPTPTVAPRYSTADLGLPPIPELYVPPRPAAPANTPAPDPAPTRSPAVSAPAAAPTATPRPAEPAPVKRKPIVRTRSSR